MVHESSRESISKQIIVPSPTCREDQPSLTSKENWTACKGAANLVIMIHGGKKEMLHYDQNSSLGSHEIVDGWSELSKISRGSTCDLSWINRSEGVYTTG